MARDAEKEDIRGRGKASRYSAMVGRARKQAG